jgi:hypothetical protein
MHSGTIVPVVAGLVVGIAFIAFFLILASVSPTISKPIFSKENQTYYAFSRDLENFTAISVPEGTCKEPSIDSIATNSKDANSLPLKQRTWITVRPSIVDLELKVVQGRCTVINDRILAENPKVLAAMQGTDRCAVRQEVCSISYGITTADARFTYDLTVSQEEAKEIAKNFGIRHGGTFEGNGVKYDYFTPATFVYNNKLYKLFLNSEDQISSADTTATYLGLPDGMKRFVPVNLTKGESYNRTLLITTYATYGGPADIHLSTDISDQSSGITAEFVPDRLLIPERSNATTTLVVTAPKNVSEGIYEIYIRGFIGSEANYNSMLSLGCHLSGHRTCLHVRVGESNWEIHATTRSGGIGISGGREPPDWFKAELQTDKDHYAIGEDVAIDLYLVNNGNQPAVLGNQSRAIIFIHNATSSERVNFYSIYASHYWRDYDNTPPLVVEPHSKLQIARTFVWDQKTSAYGELQNVKPGYYVLDLEFEGLWGVNFDVKKVISIGLE